MAGKKKTNIKKKRWTKDDTELTILALPTAGVVSHLQLPANVWNHYSI